VKETYCTRVRATEQARERGIWVCECESREKRESGDQTRYIFARSVLPPAPCPHTLSTHKMYVCLCVCTCACVSRKKCSTRLQSYAYICMSQCNLRYSSGLIPRLLLRLIWFLRRTEALSRQFARFRNFFDFAQIWGILESNKL